MRRRDCAPLAGKRRREALGDWERLPAAPHSQEEGPGRELLRQALAYGLEHCLTADQREAVELCVLQGMSVVRAAQRLGVAPSTVSRRRAKALERLRELSGLALAVRQRCPD